MENKNDVIYEKQGLTLLIRLKEDLDHHNESSIRNMADRYLTQGIVKNIVFDFSNVQFMDSSGIGVLMGRYKKTKLAGGEIAVVAAKPQVERILTFSGVCKAIPRYEKVEDAIGSFMTI